MTVIRHFHLCVAGTTISLPCFFPSVSSVKTNLMPIDYIDLLVSAAHPQFLVSAYDAANSSMEYQVRMADALRKGKERGTAILLDSGNFEGFWRADSKWEVNEFHTICRTYEHHICFCYDNQNPPNTAEAISEDVVTSVLRDQEHSLGTVVPIIHGPADLLPAATQGVAKKLYPILLAVPERALGNGILARIGSIRRIRKALDALGFYCPLHLLGTGNPLSIAAYAMAGADCFDGLEWCQTVVDHKTGMLSHFQHWDFFQNQTHWGLNNSLPYIQSVLMHNLKFYGIFLHDLRVAIQNNERKKFLDTYFSKEYVRTILTAIEEGE